MKVDFEIIIYLLFFYPTARFGMVYYKILFNWVFDSKKPSKEDFELQRLFMFLIIVLATLFFLTGEFNFWNSLIINYSYYFIVTLFSLSSYLIWTKRFKEVVSYSPERFGIKGFKVVDYKRSKLKKNFLRFNNIKIKMNFEQFINFLYLKGNKKLEPIIILDKGKNNSSANKMIVCELISVLFLETNPQLNKTSQNILLKKISINYLINSNNERIELTDGDLHRWRSKRTAPIEKFKNEIKLLLKSNSSNFYESIKGFFRKK